MPRQIIDTESSRPAYIRRNVMLAVVAAILLALVIVAVYELGFAHHHAAGAAGVSFIDHLASAARSFQGT